MGRKKAVKSNRRKSSLARKRSRRMGRLRTALRVGAGLSVLLLISGLYVFGYDYMTQCDYFRAQALEVAGARHLTPRQVIAHARLSEGMNILSVNLTLVRKRLMAHPWIEDARVSRELPDRIRIDIRENRPLAVLDLGRRFILNTEGEIFKELASGDPAALPVVTGLAFSDITVPGKPGSQAFRSVMEILRLGSRKGSVLPTGSIRAVRVDREIGLTLYTRGPYRVVRLGYGDYPGKYERLRSALVYLRRENRLPDLGTIDLNHSSRIVVRPVQADAPGRDQEEV